MMTFFLQEMLVLSFKLFVISFLLGWMIVMVARGKGGSMGKFLRIMTAILYCALVFRCIIDPSVQYIASVAGWSWGQVASFMVLFLLLFTVMYSATMLGLFSSFWAAATRIGRSSKICPNH